MAKQALSKDGNLKTKLVSKERKTVESRREEEEEEEKRKKESQAKGMETHLKHEFYVIMYEFPCLVGW